MNKEEKIGMYSREDILNYMEDREGSMLGRSMYDALMTKIDYQQSQYESLQHEIKEERHLIPLTEKLEVVSILNETREKLKIANKKLDEIKEYCNEKLKWNRDDGNDYWAGKNNAQQQVSEDILSIIDKE